MVKSKPTIWVNTLVQNEDIYIWYAINSVIEHVDKVLIWETGSTDNTVRIMHELKKLYPNKVVLDSVGKVDGEKYTTVRNEMLQQSKGDWILIVDGDEVWWENGIKTLVTSITSQGQELDSIVTHYTNVVGDIYHHQPEKAGKYKIDNDKGHLTIRAMNKHIPGLHLEKPHGTQGFFNKSGVLIQQMDKNKRLHIKEPAYLHFTHMKRSSSSVAENDVPKRDIKKKLEHGIQFPADFYYPESFFKSRPNFVLPVWKNMEFGYKILSSTLDPIRSLKRNFWEGRSGY